MKRILAFVLLATLGFNTLTGCSTAQGRFDNSFELATSSYDNGDFEMAKAHINDALKELPESEAGAALLLKINRAILSKGALAIAEKALVDGDLQVAFDQVNKLETTDIDFTRVVEIASQAATDYLEAIDTSSENFGLTDALEKAEGLIAIQKQAHISVDEQLVSTSRNSVQTSMADALEMLLDENEVEQAIDYLIQIRDLTFLESEALIEVSEKAAGAFEKSVLSDSKSMTKAKEYSKAKSAVEAALIKLSDSQALKDELARIKELIAEKAKADAKAVEEAKKKAIKAMTVKEDSFEGIKWYYDRGTYSSYAGNRFMLYMGQRGSRAPWLRLQMMMYDSDWHFFTHIKIDVDGKQYSYNPGYFGVDRDNGGFNVWEWYDHSVDKWDITMLQAIAKSKSTRIRYINDDNFYRERTVSSAQKKAIANVLLAFEALGGNLNNP